MRHSVAGGAALAGLLFAAGAEAQFSGYYRVMARHSGKALVVQSASTANSANIFQWTYGGSNTNDEWQLLSLGTGYYRVINRNSGKDMVVQSASTAEGANIFQYTYGGTNTNDEWAIVSLGNGYHRFTARHSGKSAEVVGGGTTDGTNVAQRTYSGASYQQWQIISLSGGTGPTPTPTPTPTPGGRATPTPTPTPTPSGSIIWKKANLTWFTSYPDPGSDECILYNGCQWAGQFAFVSGTQSEQWVRDHNIAAVHEKDAATYKLKTLHLKQSTREIDVVVYDMCSDSDCSGCCTDNATANGLNFLIDIEKYTMQRFGSGSGIVDWYCKNCP
jgi:predicted nucleic acid-binding Zn ribbon protein